jgi:glycerate kinase
MEMAACAGLPLVGDEKDPLYASTYGVGELLKNAASRGVKKVLLGLGGSATNDCGIGMAAALGYRFFDTAGSLLEPLAINMSRVAHITKPSCALELAVTAACDVDNPLYGPNGATYTYGMQKGAAGETLALLDAGLMNMADVISRELEEDTALLPGAGAAGGMGAGVVAFLNGILTPGIELLLDAAGFEYMLEDADCILTGEGRIDWQSARGKVPVGIANRAKKHGIPVIALCGAIGEGMEIVYEHGITAVFSAVRTTADFPSIQKTCRNDMRLLCDAVIRLLCMQRI